MKAFFAKIWCWESWDEGMGRTLRHTSVVTLALLALPGPAHAGFMDGNSLLDRCQADQSDFRKGYCAAYVAGVADSIPVMTEVSKAVCIPATATLGQLRDVTVQYLEQHPETRHIEASAIVLRALVVAFPC